MKQPTVTLAVTWIKTVSWFVVFLSAAMVMAAEPSQRAAVGPSWIDLFDGNTLEGWEVTDFGGEGEVHVEDGRILLEFGQMLTGITYQGGFPKSSYEIRFEAMRVDGHVSRHSAQLHSLR